MSVIITGMEMPYRCDECPLVTDNECPLLGIDVDEEDGSRDLRCPLKSVDGLIEGIMTREDAIAVLQRIKPTPCRADGKSTTHALEMIALDMAIKALEQEPKYCDRNICIQNEYNGIGCVECEVTKSQEPCEDWYDVPSDEMTLEQARQAVRDLRKMWAERLEQEPCGKDINVPATDAISRQAVDDAIYDYSRSCDVNYQQIMEFIEKIPSVNPQPKTGHWKKMVSIYDVVSGTYTRVTYADEDKKMGNMPIYECECGRTMPMPTNYCPDCGAKMEEQM